MTKIIDINRRLLDSGISQAEIAKVLGVHTMTVWRKLHGLTRGWRPGELVLLEKLLQEEENNDKKAN